MNLRKTALIAVGLLSISISAAAQKEELNRSLLPEPVFEARQDFTDLYWKAWELAWDHVKYHPGLPQARYMDEACWDDTIWIWDSEFMALFCKYAPALFPGLETLDNFYLTMLDRVKSPLRIQHPDNPPFFPWVEYDYYKFTGDKDHLRTLILKKKHLQRYYHMFNTLDDSAELPFKHVRIALKNKGIGFEWGGVQSGMDNTPRDRDGKILWIDAIAQQALCARYITILADKVGDRAAKKEFEAEYGKLKDIINKYYWDERDGCYYDIFEADRSISRILTPASFWPLLAEVATKEQAERMAAFALAPGKLGGEFPWTTLSRDDRDFQSTHGKYWRGSIWLPTAYMGIKAVEKYGMYDLADSTAEKILDQMSRTYREYSPHTIWECYSPSACRPADSKKKPVVRPDFCGWSALGPISLFIENVIGIHSVDAERGEVRWDIHQSCRHGIRRLRFGDITTDLVYYDGCVEVTSNNPYTLFINGKRHRVGKGGCSIRVKSPLDYVDPLIGTKGEGTQYGGMMPMTGVPFGSIQWVPMTRLTDVSRLSYNESDSLLLGFIGTRQPAIWMGDWGQVSFQPQSGTLDLEYATRGKKIDSYRFTPYRSEIESGGIRTEYAGLSHSAVYEFSNAGHIVIDASRTAFHNRSNHAFQPGHIEFGADSRSVSGWNTDMFDGQHTSPKPGFKGYFYIEFSRPFTHCGVRGDGGEEVQGYVSFRDSSAPLTLRIGVSLISIQQAKENLRSEIGRRTVGQVAAESRREWEKKFSTIDIKAADDVKTIFYTGLYHALLYPRRIDESGRYYSAFDDKIHEGIMYNCWSMWDTYRAEHPLLTIVAPERIDDMMRSLLEIYREGGWLPKWPNPCYTGIMSGSPAETILAEAWTKGFRGFDISLAYEAVRKNATVPQPNDTLLRWEDRGNFGDTPETRGGLTRYQTIGYVSSDETDESVSRTLDFGLQDRAAAILAGAAGFPEDSAYFYRRSFNYRNLWNADSSLFLPRSLDGTWADPYSGRHYTECTPYTAQWCVPYDVPGVVGLMGGRERYEAALDDFFANRFWKPERGNKSVHGNEPSHHVAYLYNRIGRPEKTQKNVREIMARSYTTQRKGFDGNEDCGQMSAWYILSSLGLYMLNPADGWYELGSPCVDEAVISLSGPYGEARLHIIAKNQSAENVCVSEVTFNGRKINDMRIHHSELAKGGTLCFEMKKP